MRTPLVRLRRALLGAAAAGLAACTVAAAGSGVGGTFNLGQTNSVDAPSVLTGNSGNAAQLRVENTGGGSALSLVVNAGVAPFKVSSSSKVGGLNSDLLDGLDSSGFWKLGGNAGTTAGTNFIGTTDNEPLVLKADGIPLLRLDPAGNLVGGSSNSALGAIRAAIGGGVANAVLANTSAATIAGGNSNTASGVEATVGGGQLNVARAKQSTVAGGSANSADGLAAAVGGGTSNEANGEASVVPGGDRDIAAGDFSFAAGRRAHALHRGAFVWADSADADFHSSKGDEFAVRASGGARFEANVHVSGEIAHAYASGTSSRAIPVAYGVIRGSDGALLSGTPNVSSTFDAVNSRYLITIAGETYFADSYITTVTPAGTTLPRFATTSAASSKLAVKLFNATGNPVQQNFSFITYKP